MMTQITTPVEMEQILRTTAPSIERAVPEVQALAAKARAAIELVQVGKVGLVLGQALLSVAQLTTTCGRLFFEALGALSLQATV